jgi:hypothetical protein
MPNLPSLTANLIVFSRVYEHAIEEFIARYCSEPRLAFNRIVVVRYRIHLEARNLAPATINQRLAAVRRLAHEAVIRNKKTAEAKGPAATPARA